MLYSDGLTISVIDVSFKNRWGKPTLLFTSRSLRFKKIQVIEKQKNHEGLKKKKNF